VGLQFISPFNGNGNEVKKTVTWHSDNAHLCKQASQKTVY